jgi:hypothetical protein
VKKSQASLLADQTKTHANISPTATNRISDPAMVLRATARLSIVEYLILALSGTSAWLSSNPS